MVPLQLLPGVSVLLRKLTPGIAQSSKPQSSLLLLLLLLLFERREIERGTIQRSCEGNVTALDTKGTSLNSYYGSTKCDKKDIEEDLNQVQK